MSDAHNSGFGRFVPGFDFLQNLARGASDAMPKMPGVSSWIAPTLDIEEIDKRISELRAVQFWLEQNGRALAATVQALEVQRMTLATLKGMDVTLTDLAEAMKVKPSPDAPDKPPIDKAPAAQARAEPAAEPAQDTSAKAHAKPADGPAQPVVDPLQWWSSLTRQFQEIAAGALKDVAHKDPVEATREFASGMEQVMKAATSAAQAAGAAGKPGPAARKTRAATTGAKASKKPRKTAPRKTATPRSPA